MPDRSHAVPWPVPVPSSRSRPARFEAASTARSAPTFGSDIMVKPSALVSRTMGSDAGGVRLTSRVFIRNSLPPGRVSRGRVVHHFHGLAGAEHGEAVERLSQRQTVRDERGGIETAARHEAN